MVLLSRDDLEPELLRPPGTMAVHGVRSVPKSQGMFIIPDDTGQAAWDLDPTAGDGDLVIPTAISNRTATELPQIGAGVVLDLGFESVDAQNLSVKLEWYGEETGNGTARYTDDQNDSDLFGPDTFVRVPATILLDYVRITVQSEVADGTQNRVRGGVNAH